MFEGSKGYGRRLVGLNWLTRGKGSLSYFSSPPTIGTERISLAKLLFIDMSLCVCFRARAMEAVTLGTKLVSSVKGSVKDSIQTSPKISGRVQSVKRAFASNQRGQNLSCRTSNVVNVPLLIGKELPHRYARTPSRRYQIVVSFMNRDDKPWSAREGGGEQTESLLSRLAKAASCAVAAGVLVFHTGLPAWADEIRITFPGSKLSEVNFQLKPFSRHLYSILFQVV